MIIVSRSSKSLVVKTTEATNTSDTTSFLEIQNQSGTNLVKVDQQGAITLNNQKISNVAAPTAANDVATKAYVDTITTGKLSTARIPTRISDSYDGSVGSQGSHIAWNVDADIGQFYLINNRGSGSGGFVFSNINSGQTNPITGRILDIDFATNAGTSETSIVVPGDLMLSPGNATPGTGNKVRIPNITSSGGAANCFIGSHNGINKTSSSIFYKKDIEDLEDVYAENIFNLRPVWYRSNENTIDRLDWSWYGLIAEEVAEIEPRLVHWSYRKTDWETITDENGNKQHQLKESAKLVPDGVQYDRLGVFLINIIKKQKNEIHKQKEDIQKLEERLSVLEKLLLNKE